MRDMDSLMMASTWVQNRQLCNWGIAESNTFLTAGSIRGLHANGRRLWLIPGPKHAWPAGGRRSGCFLVACYRIVTVTKNIRRPLSLVGKPLGPLGPRC